MLTNQRASLRRHLNRLRAGGGLHDPVSVVEPGGALVRGLLASGVLHLSGLSVSDLVVQLEAARVVALGRADVLADGPGGVAHADLGDHLAEVLEVRLGEGDAPVESADHDSPEGDDRHVEGEADHVAVSELACEPHREIEHDHASDRREDDRADPGDAQEEHHDEPDERSPERVGGALVARVFRGHLDPFLNSCRNRVDRSGQLILL